MSQTTDQMELREEEIRAHYAAALDLLDGFDHAPRIAVATAPVAEKSSGVGTRRRFRSTTPGLATRRVERKEGIQLTSRIEAVEGGDGLVSPLQATVQQSLRRAIAIALAVGEQFAERTALKDQKRANLEGSLADGVRAEFSELLTAECQKNTSHTRSFW